jgi:hypothetical protein
MDEAEKYYTATKIIFDRKKAEETPPAAVEDEFDKLNTNIAIDPTSRYLLTPYEPTKKNTHIIHIPADKIVGEMRVGDGLYVRCGPLELL